MNWFLENLDKWLIAAAVGQLCIAAINMRLDKLLHWQKELDSLSELLREVFYVHKWFISIILVIFGVLTIRFAKEIAAGIDEMACWLAASIGIFWAIRTLIQWCFYSWSHWRADRGKLAIHWILTLCYGGCSAVYLFAAFRNSL